MAFEDTIDPGWFYELPFHLSALVIFGALFALNPPLQWGHRERAPDASVPIEFVPQPPAPKPPAVVRPPKAHIAPVKPKSLPAKKKTVDAKAIISASIERRRRFEAEKARSAAALARARADERAERAIREKARAAQRAQDAERRRAAALEKAEAARRERERAAAARAAKARRKAELSQELAAMPDPDVALERAGAAPAAALKADHSAGAGAGADVGPAMNRPADLMDSQPENRPTLPDASGVSYALDGPVGNRRVIERVLPQSPDWVGARGLDISVSIRFQVLSDGRVKSGAVIEKTSGFPDIDQLALDAVRKWIFEAAREGPPAWGRVVLRFVG